uniref:U1 small nuclear ribonucleoprotein 70 kDa n=1 Tax=Xiphophorus maculatus TaxID=8083 RepID=A0A3B5QXH8_XIPMA
MTQFLPPNLLALFAPRDPIPFLPQLEKLPHEKHHNQPYCGIAPFIRHFEDPRDAPPPTRAETREERLERKNLSFVSLYQYKTSLHWDPHNDPNAQGDAFKTLFVARINYDTTESKLRREFEVYGPIKRIYIVYNKRTGKPRGYAFIEYEHERDMHSAYKHADGKKIDGRRVLVDVERGRTVKGWRPRRLGQMVLCPRLSGFSAFLLMVFVLFSILSDRGERRERSRDRDRDKDRERRRSRSRERRRHTRSRERDRERERGIVVGEDGGSSSRRRERERGGAGGGDSRSRERSRDRKRRSRSRDRKRDRERGKGLDGDEVGQGDGPPEGGERVPEEHGGEVAEGAEERKDRDRDRDRDRRRSHRDRDRRRERDRDRDREHKRERGERDRGERREERHAPTRDDIGPQDEMCNEDDGAPANMEEYSQDGMMDQQSFQSAEDYGSGENGYKMEGQGDEY